MSGCPHNIPAMKISTGNTDELNSIHASYGFIRYDTSNHNLEIYEENGWKDVVINDKPEIDISGKIVVNDVSINKHLSVLDASFSGVIDFPTGKTNVGYNNTASGFKSSALGYINIADASYSSAVGYRNTASDVSSSAFGHNNTASGNNSSALGYNNAANGKNSVAVGYLNTASDEFSSAVGRKNSASIQSNAFGRDNIASGVLSSAYGNNNTADASYSSAFGYFNDASGEKSSAFGYFNTASDLGTCAFGRGNNASGDYSVAIGYKAKASDGKMYFGINGCETAETQIYFDNSAGKMRLNCPSDISSAGDLYLRNNLYVGVGLGGIGLLAGAGALNGTGQGQGDATESSHFLAPSGYNGKAAFNNSLAQYDCWHSHTNGLPQWIEFRFPYDVILTSYKIWPRYTSPSNPSNWELRGFENGSSSYTTIHSQSSVSGWQATNQNSIASGSHYKEFPVNTTTAYRTFRLHITGAAAGSYVTIGELAFYGYIDNTSSGNIYSSSIVVEEVETDVIYNLSDDRLKHNEEEIPNALDLLNDLKPYKYQKTKTIYDASHTGYINSPWRYQIGLIAQDIQKIPYLEFAVQTDTSKGDDILGLAYNNFIGLLVQGVKDLNNENISIKEKIAQNKTAYDISLNNLQTKNQLLETENTELKGQIIQLTTDISNIKTHLGI